MPCRDSAAWSRTLPISRLNAVAGTVRGPAIPTARRVVARVQFQFGEPIRKHGSASTRWRWRWLLGAAMTDEIAIDFMGLNGAHGPALILRVGAS